MIIIKRQEQGVRQLAQVVKELRQKLQLLLQMSVSLTLFASKAAWSLLGQLVRVEMVGRVGWSELGKGVDEVWGVEDVIVEGQWVVPLVDEG